VLCEKCGRRQATWGTLCEHCEKEHADADREKDVSRIIGRLKWFALWMMGEMLLTAVLGTIAMVCVKAVFWISLVLVVLAVLCLTLAVREWWLWHGYAVRLQKGEFRQVADDLLHRPKGFWKNEIRGDYFVQRQRRRSGVSGMVAYSFELRDLHCERQTLEALLKTED